MLFSTNGERLAMNGASPGGDRDVGVGHQNPVVRAALETGRGSTARSVSMRRAAVSIRAMAAA
jgi:hypothetical protein